MNKRNLKEGNPETQFKSGREAVEAGRKGGIASGKAKRERKLLRELAQMILDEEIVSPDGRVTTQGEMALRVQARKAIKDGDVRAFEFLRDTAGQKPIERIESVEIPPEAYERVALALSQDAPLDGVSGADNGE